MADRENWSPSKIILINLLCAVFGAASGAIGFGGSLFFQPLFLTLEFGSDVTNATSIFLVFWSKIAAAVIFWFEGQIHLYFMLFLAIPCIVVEVFTEIGIIEKIRKMGRPSYLSFFFCGFMVLAIIIVTYSLGIDSIRDVLK